MNPNHSELIKNQNFLPFLLQGRRPGTMRWRCCAVWTMSAPRCTHRTPPPSPSATPRGSERSLSTTMGSWPIIPWVSIVGSITGGSATSCPYCSDWGVWIFFLWQDVSALAFHFTTFLKRNKVPFVIFFLTFSWERTSVWGPFPGNRRCAAVRFSWLSNQVLSFTWLIIQVWK